MSIWTQKDRRSYLDDAADLAAEPSGGPAKQWLAGILLAAVPIVYGIVCLVRGSTSLFSKSLSPVMREISGDAGFWLAISYIAVGAFVHFHYFWGLSERLWRFSQFGKLLAVLVFLPSFVYALYLLV